MKYKVFAIVLLQKNYYFTFILINYCNLNLRFRIHKFLFIFFIISINNNYKKSLYVWLYFDINVKLN